MLLMVWSSSPPSLLTRGGGCRQESVNQAMIRSTSVSTGIAGGPSSSNKGNKHQKVNF